MSFHPTTFRHPFHPANITRILSAFEILYVLRLIQSDGDFFFATLCKVASTRFDCDDHNDDCLLFSSLFIYLYIYLFIIIYLFLCFRWFSVHLLEYRYE